jgi:predicted nucleic acid-binding Zn ribbon protein
MNKCLYCDVEIPEGRKFCSISHSSIFTNTGRRRHGKEPSNCLKCGNKTKSHKSKFCSAKCQHTYGREQKLTLPTEKMGKRVLREYLVTKFNGKCCKCELSSWNDLPITLEMEHVDGNSENNKEQNLILLCPNCHSQTETWKGRNKGKGRHLRRQRYAAGKSW